MRNNDYCNYYAIITVVAAQTDAVCERECQEIVCYYKQRSVDMMSSVYCAARPAACTLTFVADASA